MNETQKWHESKTMRAGVVTLVVTVLTMLQAMWPDKVTAEDVETVKTNLPIVISSGAGLITTAIMMWGRMVATKRIGGEE